MPEEKSKKIKLTKREVEGLEHPESGQYLVWDSELKGFGVRVTKGAKTYFVESRVDGKTCRVKVGSHSMGFTAEQARKQATSILGDMQRGANPNTEKVRQRARVITLAEVWIEYKDSRQLRPKTIDVYDGALRRCFSDWLDKPVTDISKNMVEKRYNELKNANGPRGKGEAQAHQAMRVLRSLLNYAAGKYEDKAGKSILAENPVKRLSQAKLWQKQPRRQSVIHKSQLKDWFGAVMKLDEKAVHDKAIKQTMRDYLILCLLTGLRRNEAATLKWSDIDFKTKLLTIKGDKTKNHQDHCLPLSDYLVELLENRKNDSEYVFPGKKHGSHLVESKFAVQDVIKKSKEPEKKGDPERPGVPFMVHDLRRTFLTIAEGLDLPHYVLKRLANHKDDDVTAGYIVAGPDRLREPMQMITDFVLEHAGVRKPSSTRTRSTKSQRTTDSHKKISAV